MSSSIIRLACNVNNYHWGKHGLHSKAAQFAATNPGVTIDDSQTYAELWMGTHPSGPSKVFGTDTALSSIIEQSPEQALGVQVSRKFDGQLPFLFKVLSIEKALSIQAHPDKTLAQKLYAERPAVYKDGNHKPEMSIALTDFVAMSGFRPLDEIAAFIGEYPEFAALVKESAEAFLGAVKAGDDSEKRKQLRALFAELMNARAEDVQTQLDGLLARVAPGSDPLDISADALVHRLNMEYPGDVGVFCVFMLNVLRLVPGDAFFMGPNDPHAYIFGDCIECMATSDNVVRAGLTPKLRDVPVLVDMLTYDYGTPEGKLLRPVPFAETRHSLVYDPPIDEFSVVRTALAPAQIEPVPALDGPQVLLVVEGKGRLLVPASEGDEYELLPGHVYFVRAGTDVVIEADESSSLVTYSALCLA
ncbi:Mannose-6-phosphate isomerase [Coemansia aciculifera]|uniref:Mannose-6-phosphate isomerase n=1 Tax=Coemansia aciculifera TaxID=417176 RepID=A0A9W8M376_9FUNG|nr:Mannose-6-phosphate isomerase [Coemansia aciculifera]